MHLNRSTATESFALQLETNQFQPYASAGETLIVEPVTQNHGRKVLAKIDQAFYILIYDKLNDTYTDLNNSPIPVSYEPVIIGTITQIYGASRAG
jgi:hypothetical protein